MDAPERLAEAVEWARSALGADEREAVADTLVETAAPLDVHAAEAGRAIGAILDELESMGCDRTDWARIRALTASKLDDASLAQAVGFTISEVVVARYPSRRRVPLSSAPASFLRESVVILRK